MTSLLAWLDHNEDDRRQMREVISLFREQDTIDELGIGTVRDTLANILFLGTTTIQTRARYFLFLPWIYSEIERLRLSGPKAEAQARKLEIKLIYALQEGGQKGGEGVIGWDARENLKRFPSVIYWSGLGTYGIRRFTGSMDEYYRSLATFHRRRDLHRTGDGDEVHERLRPNWHPALPHPPDHWLDSTTLALRWEDAEFLAERIVTAAPDSLPAFLLRSRAEVSESPLPWDVPGLDALDPELRRRLDHARRFSQVMHSAPLVYNLMLGEQAISFGMSGPYEAWREKHRGELNDWLKNTTIRRQGASDWDTDDFWSLIDEHNPRLRLPTRRFIGEWITIAAERPEAIAHGDPDVRSLIKTREHRMKGSQARLVSRRALERWKGEAGTRQIDYRWPVTQRMIGDIEEGLERAAT
jgi:hypothetical protein